MFSVSLAIAWIESWNIKRIDWLGKVISQCCIGVQYFTSHFTTIFTKVCFTKDLPLDSSVLRHPNTRMLLLCNVTLLTLLWISFLFRELMPRSKRAKIMTFCSLQITPTPVVHWYMRADSQVLLQWPCKVWSLAKDKTDGLVLTSLEHCHTRNKTLFDHCYTFAWGFEAQTLLPFVTWRVEENCRNRWLCW